MLRIIFGDCEDAIYNTDVYFDNSYEDEWLEDEFAHRIIRTIDKSELLGPHVIDSPYLGLISPEKLAGGTKTLLLIRNCPDEIFNASTCGDNCAQFILQIADKRDVTINLRHLMDFGKDDFDAYIVNDDVTVKNMNQLMKYAFKYV